VIALPPIQFDRTGVLEGVERVRQVRINANAARRMQ